MGSTSGNHVLALCASLLAATVALGQSEPVVPTGEDGEKEPPKVDRAKGGFTGEMPYRLHDLPPPGKKQIDNQVVQVQLKAVEQAVGDMGPLEKSLRNVSQGIELPMGFFKVYETPGYQQNPTNPNDQPARRFMRANGGLAALYDRSNHIPTKSGLMPDIPESTIWVIGGVPMATLPGHGALLPVDPLSPGAVPQRHGASAPPPPPARVDGARVGFGKAPESMWIAVSQNKAGPVQKVDKTSSWMPFLENRAYRKARLLMLLELMPR
jgi:hypothetical protein